MLLLPFFGMFCVVMEGSAVLNLAMLSENLPGIGKIYEFHEGDGKVVVVMTVINMPLFPLL